MGFLCSDLHLGLGRSPANILISGSPNKARTLFESRNDEQCNQFYQFFPDTIRSYFVQLMKAFIPKTKHLFLIVLAWVFRTVIILAIWII